MRSTNGGGVQEVFTLSSSGRRLPAPAVGDDEYAITRTAHEKGCGRPVTHSVSHLKDRLRWSQPAFARRARTGLLDARRGLRRVAPGGRAEPNFLIIGAQRSGTTSLFRYLSQHPQVVPPLVKEVQFFSSSAFLKGQDWYRANFPTTRDMQSRANQGAAMTFEATPYYLFHPLAASRVAAALPKAKIIALLRNPVDRAFSHYMHSVQRGIEPLSFDAALRAEEERLAGEAMRMRSDERYDSERYRAFSYFARGVYVDQLAEWERRFPQEQVLVLESEAMYRDPSATYRRVVEWLGLAPWEPPTFDVFERSNTVRNEMAASTDGQLARDYAPHNQRLREHLSTDFGWTGTDD